jgi:membrane protease YdiL (CAAX protease family)
MTIYGLVGHIALNAVVGLIIVSFLAFFEELRWRAWLLPRLIDRLGARGAVVASAITWAVWHVPFQLSGIQYINGVSPIRLALVLPSGILAAGLILGWIWLRTKSIWLVTIAHGAMNNWGQYAFKYMKDSIKPDSENLLLAAANSILLMVGGLLLWQGLRRNTVA